MLNDDFSEIYLWDDTQIFFLSTAVQLSPYQHIWKIGLYLFNLYAALVCYDSRWLTNETVKQKTEINNDTIKKEDPGKKHFKRQEHYPQSLGQRGHLPALWLFTCLFHSIF